MLETLRRRRCEALGCRPRGGGTALPDVQYSADQSVLLTWSVLGLLVIATTVAVFLIARGRQRRRDRGDNAHNHRDIMSATAFDDSSGREVAQGGDPVPGSTAACSSVVPAEGPDSAALGGVLSAQQFTERVLNAAAPPERVAEVVARMLGDEVRLGPILAGPGEVASATAVGVRGKVHVATTDDPNWQQKVTVPIDLSVRVEVAGFVVRFRGAVRVRTRLRLHVEQPCVVAVDIEEVGPPNIDTAVEALGAAARLVGCVENLDETITEHVVIFVNDLIRSPAVDKALHIDVVNLLARAWDANLVVNIDPPD